MAENDAVWMRESIVRMLGWASDWEIRLVYMFALQLIDHKRNADF